MARRHLEQWLSGDELNLDEVWDWYDFQTELLGDESARTLEAFDSGMPVSRPRYHGEARDELRAFFDGQREELGRITMLTLLSATEAALKVDFIVRVMRGKKDAISKRFAAVYKSVKLNVRLDQDILEIWKTDPPQPSIPSAVGEFRGALNLRHWLAHGRYWKTQFGREYAPQDVFDICDGLLRAVAIR